MTLKIVQEKTGKINRRVSAAALSLVTLALAAGLAWTVRAQDNKSTDVSKVVRLNRAPVNKEILRVKLPRPTIVKLPNGMTLLLLEDHKLPTVSFDMMIRPGQLSDPDDLPGLASMTAGMLRQGTENRSSLEISTEIDSMGAGLGANSAFGSGYTSVTASGLSTNADRILDLLSDIVLHPSFPETELAQYKQREEAGLEQRRSSPGFLAGEAMHKMLFVEPPLSVVSPTKDSIERVTAADLKKFHDQHFRPGNSLFGVSGDFKSDEMRALVEKYFGAWSGTVEPAVDLPPAGSPAASKVILVDRPGSVQTYLMAGTRSIRRSDPDFFPLVVMNEVLGGGPQSRLFLDLREEHSYTYGAYSQLETNLYPGEWLGYAPVQTAVTDGSMDRFAYEYKRIASEPVPDSELDDARRAIVASFALSLENPAQVLGDWMTVQYYGLPADYWDTYPDRIAAIDSAKVQAVAKKYIDVGHLQWVAVGDREQIEGTLKKYGPVTVIDSNGKPEP